MLLLIYTQPKISQRVPSPASQRPPSISGALLPLVLLDVVNHAAVWIGSYLLFATAGPAFPAQYKHDDGGTYRGQWRGMRKEGLGAYVYPGGARCEGGGGTAVPLALTAPAAFDAAFAAVWRRHQGNRVRACPLPPLPSLIFNCFCFCKMCFKV